MHGRSGPIRMYLGCMGVAAFSHVSADRIRKVWVNSKDDEATNV